MHDASNRQLNSKGENTLANTFSRLIGCFALSAVLAFMLFLPVESYGASSFKDIKGHWAEQYIETAVAQGIIKGYTDGRFLPDERVSRAEFISMVNRALGNTSTGSTRFSDVSSGAWYYADVSKAVTAGFVSGFDDGTFRPNYKITRQEAAVMLARIIPTYGYSTNLNRYGDYRSISDWAYTAMSKVSGKGYITGYTDGKIHPLDSLTRAQAAKIISDITRKETIVTTDPMVKKDGTKLSGRIYSNNVTIHKDLDDGDATIDNCVILGKLIVQGGGEDTITINNSRVADAVVNRSADPVRLLAKGETAILNTQCSQNFALQTSGLSGGTFGTGFERVSFASSSSGTLQGTFPYVSLDGSSADLQLLSGTITTLDVNSAGRRSDITVESKATINLANVYGESYFHGTGTISDMQVYAKGVTYETKPRKWSIRSGGETPSHNDPELTMAFSPARGATKVYLDTKITITFNSAMREEDKSTITNAEIQDIVTIRKGSATGSRVDYTGAINSAKTVMTLTPSELLDESTRYYIVVKADTMIDSNGEKNEGETSYFNTGTGTEKLAVTYSPANGSTNVPVSAKTFTINFTEGVKRYNGNTLSANDSYLRSDVVLFQRGSTSVSTGDYTVSINSAKTRITITLDDDYSLALNTKYTIGIRSSKLKTAGGEIVPASNASWTTAGNPVLSNVNVVPYETAVDLKATPNVSGKIYAVLLAGDKPAPTAVQIKDGKDASGGSAIVATNVSATASNVTTLKFSGENIKRDTAYKVYAVLYDGNNNPSSVVSASVKTEPLKLKSLTVIPDVGSSNVLTGFSPDKTVYDVIVPNGTSYVEVIAEANASSFIGDVIINGEENATADISLSGGKATVTVIVQEEGKSPVTYKVTVREAGTAELESMTIGQSQEEQEAYDPSTGEKYPLEEGPKKVFLVINPEDPNSTIRIGGETKSGGESIEINLGATTTEVSFVIEASDGVTKKTYKIRFDRTTVPLSTDDGAGDAQTGDGGES